MIASFLPLMICLQILFHQIHGDDTFDCTGYDDDSFHPMYDSNDCRHYWHCIFVDTVYMRAVKRTCPAGTKFDIQLNECEISSLVNCDVSITSTSTKKYSKLFRRSTMPKTPLVDMTTTDSLQQLEVLPITTSQLTPVLLIEHVSKTFITLLKNLMAMQQKSSTYVILSKDSSTTYQTTTLLQPSKRRHRRRHKNLTLNILTSHEHKIRQFSLNQTHGLLIQCDEIRRRHLRDLIFRTTTYSIKTRNNSSSKLLPCIIFIITILIFLQKK